MMKKTTTGGLLKSEIVLLAKVIAVLFCTCTKRLNLPLTIDVAKRVGRLLILSSPRKILLVFILNFTIMKIHEEPRISCTYYARIY